MPGVGQRSVVSAKTVEPGPEFRSGSIREIEEEQALLAALAAEDASAFRALLDRHLAGVLATARRMLNDAGEAEDVAQETMLRLWRSGGNVEIGPGGLRPWLRRVAVNLCIDRQRSGKHIAVGVELPEEAQEAGQQSALEAKELSGRVGAALKALPERQRQALTLFHYEGMSQTEIAGAMEISEDAVESLLARARRSLKQGLRTEWQRLISDEA